MAATGKNTIEKTIAELPEELQQVVAKWADRLDQQQAELPEQKYFARAAGHRGSTEFR
jgi:hypothetical protein